MTSDRHQRAMQLFQQICELPEKDRPAFLDQACQGDPDLHREVKSLLQHYSPATISTKPHVLTTKMPTGRSKRFLSQYMPRFRPRLPSWWPILAGLLLLVLLLLIWRWVENGVRHQLTHSMEERLELVVRANVTALDNWFMTEKESIEAWAKNPALMEDVTQLVKDSQRTTSTVDLQNRLLDSDVAQQIRDRLEPTEEQAGELGVVIVRFDGRVLIHEDPSRLGKWIYPEFEEALKRVLDGETVLLRPSLKIPEVLGYEVEKEGPITALVTPIASDDGGVQAALVFAMLADEELTTVLDTARIGDAGENYVFVGDQIVLSSRHKWDEWSHLSQQPGTPAPNSPLAAPVPVAPQPSARGPSLSADATSSSQPAVPPDANAPGESEADPEGASSVEEASPAPLHWNLEGYRSYSGQQVIAAWQWLPQHGFGVATEVSKTKAYAPLAYVTKSFRWLFSAVSLLTLATFLATLSVAHLRNRAQTSQQLGPYTLQSLIGQGGMGKVYRAQHALLRRPTAVKLLEGEHADPASVQRFEREVQLTSQLTHPNTIQIYDFGRSLDGVFYYAMEYLEGPTLAKLVAMDVPIPVARTVHILQQVCGSLREAHDQGLVHRDIKPQNIMLCCRGGMYDFVKVLDFGLVKEFTGASDQLTQAATISGTPAYIAPERVGSPDTLDGRSDLYSLGAVAFYLLTGKEVFQGKTAVDVLVRALHDDVPRPSSRTTTVIPAALDDLVAQCLQKEPSERPETVGEVLRILDLIAEAAPWSPSQAQAWWEEHWIAQQRVDADGVDGVIPSVKKLPARH